jgi:hypothetical protein
VRSLLRNSGPWALLAALFLWFQWGPSVDTFRLGQPNILVLLLLYLAWKCALGGRNHLPGALLGFATTIKLTPLVMFPILMIRKRWRTLIIACGTCLLVLLVCFPTLNWEYFTQLLPALKRATGDVDQPSIPFFLHRLFEGIQSTSASWSAPATKVIIMILCGVAYFIVLATARWRGREWSLPDLLLFGIGIVPLFSAKESHHYMVSVLPAFIVFASLVNSRSMLFRGSRKVLVGLGILLWLPMFYETTSLSFLWEGIGSVTGLWHRDQLMFAQALWFFVLWPRLHQRVGERPLAKESS